MQKRKVFISGGVGFIGSNLAKYHLDCGDNVVVYDNLSRKGTEINLSWLKSLRGNFKFIKGDIRDFSKLKSAIKDSNIIYHEAAQVAVTSSLKNPLEDFEINALGTINMLEAFKKYAPKATFVYSSTNKVYGGLEDVNYKIKESRYTVSSKEYKKGINEKRPLDFHSPYGCSKGAGDQYVRDYSRVFGLNTVVFRQSCIYGQRQFGSEDQGWVFHFVKTALKKKKITIFGNGKQTRDILYVNDLIEAYTKAVENPKVSSGKIYNVGGGIINSVSLIELIKMLENILGYKIDKEFSGWREGDQKFYVSDNSLIKKELGWSPKVGKEKGLQLLISWAKEVPSKI
jgi:CDP-paratose 2-epimerase